MPRIKQRDKAIKQAEQMWLLPAWAYTIRGDWRNAKIEEDHNRNRPDTPHFLPRFIAGLQGLQHKITQILIWNT